jgi:spore coat protein JB
MDCENNNKEELLKKVMEYKFAINDIVLFLDTHPCDEKALKAHNEFVTEFKKLKAQYEEEYGPLCVETEIDSWSEWVDSKWPWEKEVM